MKKFKIYKDNYYYENQILYKKDIIEFKDNTITCLVGCNGIGKSALINQIVKNNKDSLKRAGKAWDLIEGKRDLSFQNLLTPNNDKEITENDFNEFYMAFDKRTVIWNTEDDLFMNDLGKNASSTGQANLYNFEPSLGILDRKIEEHPNTTFYLIFDDLDVGVSINTLKIINKMIDRIVKKLEKYNITYYIILTANSYELVKNRDCVSCVDFDHYTFNDYETYADFVEETAKWVNEREKLQTLNFFDE